MKTGANILVTIAGVSGSGKSMISQVIAREMLDAGLTLNYSPEGWVDDDRLQEKLQSFNKGGCGVTIEEVILSGNPVRVKSIEALPTEDEVEAAKEVLRNAGYAIDNCWTVHDVKDIIVGDEDLTAVELSDDECMNILIGVLNSEYQTGEIKSSIKDELDNFYKE